MAYHLGQVYNMTLKRIIDNKTKIFLRDEFEWSEEFEIALEVDPSQGLYRARWNGVGWTEDMTQKEIDELNNQNKEMAEMELLMLAVAELDMKRSIDKTETEMTIVELAETLLGGV